MKTFSEIVGLKVLWMMPAMGYGGDLLYWAPILRSYADRVPNLEVLCGIGPEEGRYPQLPLRKAARSWRVTVPWLRKSVHPYTVILPSPWVIVQACSVRPRVLVLSEFGSMTLFGLIAARLIGGCRLLLLVESDPGGNESSFLGWRRRLRRFVARRCTAILTNNASGRRYLEESLDVPPAKVMQAPYLVSAPSSPARPASTALATAPKKARLQVLYVGRLIEGKGVGLLIQAVARLAPGHREQVQVRIVGDGPDHEALSSLSRRLGVADTILFCGRVPYTQMAEQYGSSDVFVLPTRSDYRALVGFEALSQGLPLLISKYDGAASEVVEEGKNGFIFDPLDVPGFTRKLAWFIDNSARLHDFRSRSYQMAEAFTVEKAAANLVRATKRCMDSTC